jgi:hypothetical protein
MGTKNEMNEVLEYWENRTRLQKWVIFILFWLLMQKKQKLFWLILSAAIVGPLLYAFMRDPFTAIITLAIGMAIGLLFILWWN